MAPPRIRSLDELTAKRVRDAAVHQPSLAGSTPAPKRARKGRPKREPGAPLLTHMIHIQGWQAVTVNELLAAGRWAWTLKKKDRKRIAAHVALLGLPPATGKRRVTLTLTMGKRQRTPDPDGVFKSLLDALVHAKMLVDDNKEGLQLMPVRFERGAEKATTILLEDMEDANS